MKWEAEDVYQALIGTGLSDSDIERQVKKKTEALGDFMSPDTVLFIMAKEMGLDIGKIANNPEFSDDMEDNIDYDDFIMNISELEEGMSNIVIAGRITRIFPIREFTRKDGSKGIVGSFLLNDGSGTIKVVLWDQQVKIMRNEFFVVNEVIRIIGGYSKMGIRVQLEAHLGKKGKIKLALPGDAFYKKIPEVKINHFDSINSKSGIRRISELFDKEGFISRVSGVVHMEGFSEKALENGEKSFLLRFSLSDEKGSIQVVAWGDDALNCLKQMNDGDEIKLSNIVVGKNSYTGMKQIRFTKKTSVLKIME